MQRSQGKLASASPSSGSVAGGFCIKERVMNNETDLDWMARNVHEWPAGEHQSWCYVYMAHGGVMKASGNFLDAVAKPTMITIDQWLARRAELQNKPSWNKKNE